jgi:hypothetical protein
MRFCFRTIPFALFYQRKKEKKKMDEKKIADEKRIKDMKEYHDLQVWYQNRLSKRRTPELKPSEFKPFQIEALKTLIVWGEKRDKAIELVKLACQYRSDINSAEELVSLVTHSEPTEGLRYFYAQGHFWQKSSTPKKKKTLATD